MHWVIIKRSPVRTVEFQPAVAMGIGWSVLVHLPLLGPSGDAVFRAAFSRRLAAFLVDLSPRNYMGSATVALVVRLW